MIANKPIDYVLEAEIRAREPKTSPTAMSIKGIPVAGCPARERDAPGACCSGEDEDRRGGRRHRDAAGRGVPAGRANHRGRASPPRVELGRSPPSLR